MCRLLWLDKKNFDDIFVLVHGAFIGWITDSMRAAYMANSTRNELDLVILFIENPNAFDMNAIDEILSYIRYSMADYGLKKINLKKIIIKDTIAGFKEEGAMWINTYWAIFEKYDPMPYDIDESA